MVTSNRAVEERPELFDAPIFAGGAPDRLANASCEIVINGERYRQRLPPPSPARTEGGA